MRDVSRQLIFPQHIATTNLRPDTVLLSRTEKTVQLIELSVLHNNRIDEAQKRRRLKSHEFIEQYQDRGWKAWCFPVEVGFGGFPAQSEWRTLGMLGTTGKKERIS